MHLVIDLIVLAIIVLNVILSSKNGFVKTLIELVGFVLAIVISLSVSSPIAGFIYDKTVEPAIVSSVTEKVSDSADNASEQLWISLPSFIKNNAEKLGLTSDKIAEDFENNSKDNIKQTATKISQDAVKPVFVKIISVAVAAVLFIILMLVVKFLAKFINKLFSFSIVGKLNTTLGAVLGFGKGVLIAIAVCMIITFIVSLTTKGFLIFTREAIDKTYIFNFLSGILNR